MPYIAKPDREGLYPVTQFSADFPGDLNYQFTVLVKTYIELHGLNYQTINDVIGALESAKLEFYRRVAIPYENKKRDENGDVYA